MHEDKPSYRRGATHIVDDAWETFDRRTGRATKGQPAVSIQKRGTFGLNRAAYMALGQPRRVRLLSNRAANAIGFKAAPEEDPRAYPLREQARGSSWQVSGKAFLQTYGIPILDHSRRYRADLQQDLLVVHMNQDAEAAEHGKEQ